jgi:hypothetical protein
LIFINFILLTITTNLSAFTLNNNANLAFSENPIYVNVADGFCSNIGRDENELLSIAEDAVNQYWNKAVTARLKIRKGNLKSVASDFYTDLICNPSTSCDPNPTLSVSSDILISCNNNTTNFTSSSILAITVPNNISGTKIKGSLIILNDTASTVIDQKSRDELVAIMAHEIGHAIGLGHSPVVDSLMYYSVIPKRRSLGVDDIDGITYLYPKQQPVSCGQIIDSKNNLNGFIVPMLLGLVIALLSYLAFLKLRPRFSHSLS